jgi:hypothetical protein
MIIGASRMTRKNTTLSFKKDLRKFTLAHVVAPIVTLAKSFSMASVSLFITPICGRDFVNLSEEVGNLALRGILDKTSESDSLDFGDLSKPLDSTILFSIG